MSAARDLMERRIAKGTARERFVGVEPEEIDRLEADLGVKLPEVYRDYLRLMGREPGGARREFDLRFGCLRQITSELEDAAARAGAELGGKVVALCANQGVDYLYIRDDEARATTDPPVHRLRLARGGSHEGCPSVSSYLAQMLVEGGDFFL